MVENFKPFSLEKMYNVITIKQKCKYILNALYMCKNLVKNDTNFSLLREHEKCVLILWNNQF